MPISLELTTTSSSPKPTTSTTFSSSSSSYKAKATCDSQESHQARSTRSLTRKNTHSNPTTQQQPRTLQGLTTETLRRKKRKSQSPTMSSNPPSAVEGGISELKRNRRRGQRMRSREMKKRNRVPIQGWQALAKKKTFCLHNSLPGILRGSHQRKKRKLLKIARI